LDPISLFSRIATVGVVLPTVLEALTLHLGDRFPDVRQAAALALVRLGICLFSCFVLFYFQFVSFLEYLSHADAVGVLIQVARDTSRHYRMRHAAALALVPMGRFGANAEFVTLLLQTLARKGSPSDRRAALHALDKACIACQPQTREAVAAALEMLIPEEKNSEVSVYYILLACLQVSLI
jgi:HEAT repeat protein